ncbi:hypothetical protein GGR01_001298 [Acetobacter oeni]|nr:hypothetical protein [Acetobacter oeni]
MRDIVVVSFKSGFCEGKVFFLTRGKLLKKSIVLRNFHFSVINGPGTSLFHCINDWLYDFIETPCHDG